MNAPTPNLPAERKPQLVAGAPVAALVPQTLEEAFRLSGALAASGMAPRGMDKPEQIMVAIMAGAELGLAPFQSLQSFAVINGKPSIWGDGMLAVVRARGVKVKEWFDNDDEPTKAFCHVTRPDTGEEVERTFSLSDAKKANLLGKTGPWQTNQKRMLQMRARAFALRDGCADMLRGMQVREEVEDYQQARVVGPQAAGLRERLAGAPAEEGFNAAQIEHREPEVFTEHAEEIADAEFSEADQPPADEPAPDVNDAWDHLAWATAMSEAADKIETADDVQAWWNEVSLSDEYKALIAADEAEALALKAHAVRRKRDLAQAQAQG